MRVPEPEGFSSPFIWFSICSAQSLLSRARYVRFSRLGISFSGGSFSREELKQGRSGSLSGLTARVRRGEAVLSRFLGFVEWLLFPFLELSGFHSS